MACYPWPLGSAYRRPPDSRAPDGLALGRLTAWPWPLALLWPPDEGQTNGRALALYSGETFTRTLRPVYTFLEPLGYVSILRPLKRLTRPSEAVRDGHLFILFDRLGRLCYSMSTGTFVRFLGETLGPDVVLIQPYFRRNISMK